MRPPFSRRDVPLAITALAAMAWVVARAWVQSVTIDEAETYLVWVARAEPSHWAPASNNHVLNSLLMRLFTSVFGASHLTVRAPALIGAAIYIGACYFFSKLIAQRRLLEWALFVCLVYNPFILDYLVAARGYGLATGLLLAAVLIPAWCKVESAPGNSRLLLAACAWISGLLALSLASNFSFAFVNAAALVCLFLWVRRAPAGGAAPRSFTFRLAGACVVPGLIITIALSAPALLRWPTGQLWFGAQSLFEMLQSVIGASLYEVNPQIVNPLLYPVAERVKWLLFPAVVGFALWRLALLYRNRLASRDRQAAWLLDLASALAATGALALLAHYIAFRVWLLPLPKDRTALFYVPLFLLVAGILAALPAASRSGELSRRGLTLALLALGCYFIACLRLNYFKEWKWNADVKNAYDVLAYYNHAHGVREVGTSWHFVRSLNFYRALSRGRESLAEFEAPTPYPEDRQVYFLHYGADGEFLRKHRLKIVYRSKLSETAVAVTPDRANAKDRHLCGPGNP